MNRLVKLRKRPSRDGRAFKYILDCVDENEKRCRPSLGHADKHKAERQRTQKEGELRMGVVMPQSMKLSDFVEDSLAKTGSQIRESTQREHRFATKHFMNVIGNVDYQSVSLGHGEQFRQACLDQGNSAASVSKKLRALKRLFQLALERDQLDENPFRFIKLPRWTPGKIDVFTDDECDRIIKTARECHSQNELRWDLLIAVALSTAMRRGELLNTVWADIDFEKQCLEVSPKKRTAETWEWQIKDNERRTVPLEDYIVPLLAEHQGKQPEAYPYVFVPPSRYDQIQQIR